MTVLPVDRYGMVDPEDVRRAITPRTILITVMHANNEVGTIEPIPEIAAIAREAGIPFHTDAAQTVGKISADVEELGVDLLSVAGHKVYAPKGIGALYIREGTKIEPFVHGAGHEAGRRAGTENVLLAVALGAACEVARKWVGMPQVKVLRDRFRDGLRGIFGEKVTLNGHPTARLPNTLNVNFVGQGRRGCSRDAPRVAASTGSACHAGSVTLSPSWPPCGCRREKGMGAVRFSSGPDDDLGGTGGCAWSSESIRIGLSCTGRCPFLSSSMTGGSPMGPWMFRGGGMWVFSVISRGGQ